MINFFVIEVYWVDFLINKMIVIKQEIKYDRGCNGLIQNCKLHSWNLNFKFSVIDSFPVTDNRATTSEM